MYAVGRLSSYITRGVSTVSGPFHPFGGAIDIVVVQQQDGSLKSSPWYVRFGKFQGVLKARERVVDINVNGVEADFHMYLNPRGEAYFLRKEVGYEELRSGEADSEGRCLRPIKSKSMDYNYDHCNSLIDVSNAQAFSRNLGFVLERKNINNDKDVVRKSADSAEIAADLLEMKWSTSLSTKTNNKNHGESDKDDGEIIGGKLEASLVLHEEHFVNERNREVTKGVDEVMVANVDSDGIVEVYEGHLGPLENGISKEEPLKAVDGCFTCIRQEEVESCSELSPNTFEQEMIKVYSEGLKGNLRRFRSDTDIAKSCKYRKEVGVRSKSLPNLWSQWDMLRKDGSRIIKEASNSQSADTKLKDGDASNIGHGNGKSWSLWPFTKTPSKRFSHKEEHYPRKDSDFGCGPEVDGEKDPLSKTSKMCRELTPTPEQLESLNLTEGKNTVTFKFSTAVLGNQQVDARIFLWRWDSRIVISDVDGTITKSDVLGQFMPLVGRDWSHIGVTHLFSAIKENGYHLLFLSARSISQADVTRQFLINLKQEGKGLPEGPVVISPDGLFPSLFREVIRRAPHEFKIACLEDIRACFPMDWNPFYAGFGNRDTDEFSYIKVGIPKGKIFIINPKGEVVVNRCNDTKSYSSLHSIVNGIFPPLKEVKST